MIKKVLNIGVFPSNSESLNRKIRIGNLVSFITVIAMIGYIPVALFFNIMGIVVLDILFLVSSCVSFYLHSSKKYNLAFYLACSYGLIYFTFGSVFYGLESNLQFFIVIMCLIAIALFDSVLALRIYITFAVSIFCVLIIYMHGKPGIIFIPEEMKKSQYIIGIINLFLFLFITILFFIFFRRENLLFQKDILKQKEIIEEKQKEIIDSINYAKRIQFALLASEDLLQRNLPEYFVLFNPKDVVSGDFYWATSTDEGFIYITADCTGHGVPGAFMSLLNISKLSQVINENKVRRPDLILNNIRTEIINVLNSEGSKEESKDGMDAVICKLDIKNLKLEYAAANNSFYIIRQNQLISCKADKMPVGMGHDDSISFTYNQIALEKGDVIYTFTDGYADQFGGPKGKKFKYKQLEEVLLSIHHLPMNEQSVILNRKFQDWKGKLDQIDDVLIMGIRI
jgi:serine phosphatase RsbU (regulator of sigma subunit)